MPKPQTRLPSTAPAAGEAPAAVAPAPDNGVPFAQRAASAEDSPGQRVKRRGKQLGARIPSALYERLVACSESTRIPQGRLVERALDVELKTHGF